MKILCVAEKPSMAKSLAQILSSGSFQNRVGKDKFCRNYDFQYRMPGHVEMVDMVMTSVRGHLTENDFGPEHKSWYSCDPAALFEAPIITDISSDAKAIALNLRQEVRNADAIMIWTDCDREGEHIGLEIITECRKVKRGIRVMRARFSAIIANQIHAACQNTVDLDWKSASAVEARIELDLRIGAAFTRLQTKGLQSRLAELRDQKMVISYGPCQFPTLGFVVDRYEKVINFVPEQFWHISVTKDRTLDGRDPGPDDDRENTKTVQFNWDRGHLFDHLTTVILCKDCVDNPEAKVTKVQSKRTHKFKPYPLTTVELQKSGSRLLRLAPKKILDISESLYQRGLLSYPRTETDQYDKAFDFHSLIAKQISDTQWGDIAARLNAGEFERPRNGKKDDKAHPPIHPTAHANNLTGDEKRVYDYITRRFLGSCWKDAIGRQTNVEIEIAKEKFHASGLTVHERNFLEVCTFEKWEGNILPEFTQGETFIPTTCDVKRGQTSPPKLLTEADLVSLMDKNGIGTDATIAEHISKVIDRNYVMKVKEGKATYLVPSTLGIGLVHGYNKINFEKSLSKPMLRRETEYRMSLICAGQRTKAETVAESIEEYRSVYALAYREFGVIAETVGSYLRDPNAGQEARVVHVAGDPGDEALLDGDDSDSDGSDDDANGRGASTRGGRARGRGRGRTTGTSTRGRGANTTARRGTTRSNASAARPPPPDEPSDDGDDDPPGPAPPRARLTSSSGSSNANGRNGNGTSFGGAPTCSCGNAAVERTVRKEGENQNRKFWACSQPMGSGCGFFEWCDGPSRPTSRTTTTMIPSKRALDAASTNGSSHAWSSSGGYAELQEDEVPTCPCGLAAKLVMRAKGSDQGRSVYVCSRESTRLRCKFYQYADADADGVGRGAASGGGSSWSDGACFKCGQEGHMASDCRNGRLVQAPKRKRGRGGARGGRSGSGSGGGRGSQGGGKGGGGCFHCGQEGHWASDCPNR